MLSQRTVSALLVAHLVIVWSAVALRIDRYPLTWAPMYTTTRPPKTKPKATKKAKIIDKTFLASHGWHATHRDGSRSWVSRADINVPMRSMWRLYYERTYGKPAPKIRQLNADAGNFDRWLFALAPGDDFVTPDPQRDLLVSVNRTLGYDPEDPSFIVALEATVTKRVIEKASGEEIDRGQWTVSAEWNPAPARPDR